MTDGNDNNWGDNPFESAFLGGRRLVWDQVVHEFAGEGCSFWLFSWQGKTQNLREYVGSLLDQAEILGASVYVLYGYYDVLVRAWVTPAERELFSSLLFNKTIGSLARFDAFEVDYSRWSMTRGLANADDVATFLPEIERLTMPCEDDDLRSRDIASVLDHGLAHLHDTEALAKDTDYLKLYLAFRQSGSQSDFEAASRAMTIDSVIGGLEFLTMPSVYYGRGPDIYCLVKGLVAPDDIGTLYEHVDELEGRLAERGLELEPMTLITARYRTETDHDGLRLERHEASVQERRLLTFLSEQASHRWQSVDPDRRDAILDKVDLHWEKVRQDDVERELLLSLVETAVLQDKNLLNSTLSMLFEIEGLLRTWVTTQLLPEALGKGSWRGIVVGHFEHMAADALSGSAPDAAQQSSLHQKRAEGFDDPSQLSLGAIFYGLRELVSGGILDGAQVATVLGDQWDARLRRVLTLRNRYAHAEFWDVKYVKDSQLWGELADKVISAGRLRTALEKVTS